MIKYYCDRCKNEAETLTSVKIPVQKQIGFEHSCFTRQLDVCEKCKNEADEIFDTLIDIKLSMFAKYLKKGGGQGCNHININSFNK